MAREAAQPAQNQAGPAGPSFIFFLPSPVSRETGVEPCRRPGPPPAKIQAVRPSVAGPQPAAATAGHLPPSLSLHLSLSLRDSRAAPPCAGGTAGRHGRPDLHRTHARRRWRSPPEAQARRAGGHSAGPEPSRGPAWFQRKGGRSTPSSAHSGRLERPGTPPLSLLRLPRAAGHGKGRNPFRSPPSLLSSLSLSMNQCMAETGAYQLRKNARDPKNGTPASPSIALHSPRRLGTSDRIPDPSPGLPWITADRIPGDTPGSLAPTIFHLLPYSGSYEPGLHLSGSYEPGFTVWGS